MKYITGFALGIVTVILLQSLSRYVLAFTIPEFMIGWMSCMGYGLGVKLYETTLK